MQKVSDSSHPDFWTTRYASGKTPWDFGGVPAALKSFLARSSVPSKVLIPGCGSGYEVQAFHAAGHDVTGIDFSPGAVDQAKRVLGGLAERVILGDFFTHDFGQCRFDLIYERTFLCSMALSHWPNYVNRMADLLSPGGRLMASSCTAHSRCQGRLFLSQKPTPSSFSRDASSWSGVKL